MKPCPWCDCVPDETCVDHSIERFAGEVRKDQETFCVVCPECEAQGPFGTTEAAAIEVWDQRSTSE